MSASKALLTLGTVLVVLILLMWGFFSLFLPDSHMTPMQKCHAAGLRNCHVEVDTDGSTNVYGAP